MDKAHNSCSCNFFWATRTVEGSREEKKGYFQGKSQRKPYQRYHEKSFVAKYQLYQECHKSDMIN